MEAVSRQHLGLFFSLTPPSFLYFALQSLCSRFDHSRSHRVFVNAQCVEIELHGVSEIELSSMTKAKQSTLRFQGSKNDLHKDRNMTHRAAAYLERSWGLN